MVALHLVKRMTVDNPNGALLITVDLKDLDKIKYG